MTKIVLSTATSSEPPIGRVCVTTRWPTVRKRNVYASASGSPLRAVADAEIETRYSESYSQPGEAKYRTVHSSLHSNRPGTRGERENAASTAARFIGRSNTSSIGASTGSSSPGTGDL